jgi:hypothetical protein
MNKEQAIPNPEVELLAQSLGERFIQRRDLYPKQLDDGRYVCIRKPLNSWHLAAHLQGEITLGAYLLDESSQARYIVFDADDDPMLGKLTALARDLGADGVPSYLEQSRRGGHLWLFFAQPVSGNVARLFGKGLVNVYELGDIELFPKQSRLKDGPGSLVRLPFGIHRRTGERYGFITPDGQPLALSLPEQVQLLSAPQTVPLAAFNAYRKFGSKTYPKAEIAPVEVPTGSLSKRIKDSVSAFDFISQYVALSPAGKGLCPFHDDNRFSLSVNLERNYWNCFAGCGGGSIIDFWMKKQNCDFKTALRELAGMLLKS